MLQSAGFVYRVVDSFFRHRFLFLFALVGVTVVVMSTLYLRAKKYTASAMVYVITETEDFNQVIGQQTVQSWVTPAQRSVNRLNDMLGDDSQGGFLENVLREAKPSPPINVDRRAQDPRLKAFRSGLSIGTQSDNQFAINMVWEEPEECERMVKAVRTIYIDRVAQTKKANSAEVEIYLKNKVAEEERAMGVAEALRTKFLIKNNGVTPEQQQNKMYQLTGLEIQRQNSQIELESARRDVEELKISVAKTPRTTTGETRRTRYMTDDDLKLRMYQEQRIKATFGAGLAESSDKVRGIDQDIAKITARILAKQRNNPNANVRVDQTLEQENPEYTDLVSRLRDAESIVTKQQQQLKNLNEQIAKEEVIIAGLPKGEQELRLKTRDYDLHRTNYMNYSKQLQDVRNKAQIDELTARASLVEFGTTYAEPTTSVTKVALMFIGSMVMGLICALVLVVVTEWLDPTLRYESDVEMQFDLPVLVSVGESPQLRANPATASLPPSAPPASHTGSGNG